MITRPRPKTHRNRQALRGVDTLPGASITSTAAIVATKARITFAAPVVVTALPVAITRQAAGAGPQLAPTAYTVISPTVLDMTYAAPVVATDKLTIPANVPQIRGVAGGYVAASVTTF